MHPPASPHHVGHPSSGTRAHTFLLPAIPCSALNDVTAPETIQDQEPL